MFRMGWGVLLFGSVFAFSKAPADPAGLHYRNTGKMTYALYVPKTLPPTHRSLIVALHGCKQTADDIAKLTELNSLSEKMGFLVVYPEQSIWRNWDYCWNWFYPENQKRGSGEPDFISKIVASVQKSYGILAARTSVVGLSSGGAMAMIYAFCYPDQVQAIGVHSGVPYGAAEDIDAAMEVLKSGSQIPLTESSGKAATCSTFLKTPLSAIVLHGLDDERLYPINSEQVVEQIARANAEIFPKYKPLLPLKPMKQSRVTPPAKHSYTVREYGTGTDVLIQHVEVDKMGHAWSGGPTGLKYSDPSGPKASKMILDFFQSVGTL